MEGGGNLIVIRLIWLEKIVKRLIWLETSKIELFSVSWLYGGGGSLATKCLLIQLETKRALPHRVDFFHRGGGGCPAV